MQEASKREGSWDTMSRTGAGELTAAMDLDIPSGNMFSPPGFASWPQAKLLANESKRFF
jgi:hypothetical protein